MWAICKVCKKEKWHIVNEAGYQCVVCDTPLSKEAA